MHINLHYSNQKLRFLKRERAAHTNANTYSDSNRNISHSTNTRWQSNGKHTIAHSMCDKVYFCVEWKKTPLCFRLFLIRYFRNSTWTNSVYLVFHEKKGGGGDGDEGKSMSHWEYIMHDCCCARIYTFTVALSLKCVPHRYLSRCHIWATLKCGDENRWNVCEHTH